MQSKTSTFLAETNLAKAENYDSWVILLKPEWLEMLIGNQAIWTRTIW